MIARNKEDKVLYHFWSDCLLPTLLLISCVELSLLGLKKGGCHIILSFQISFFSKKKLSEHVI
jgi:hypothetical protein